MPALDDGKGPSPCCDDGVVYEDDCWDCEGDGVVLDKLCTPCEGEGVRDFCTSCGNPV